MKTVAIRTLQQRVQRSAKQLDKDVPGWHKRINVARLNMNNWDHCICGQLKLGETLAKDRSRGFMIADENDEYTGVKIINSGKPRVTDSQPDYHGFNMGVLLRLWTAQVQKRLRCDEKKAIDAMFRC